MRIGPAGRRGLLIGVVTALAFAVGACAGTTATATPARPSAAASAAPQATAASAPSAAPNGSLVPPSFASDKDLEAALPGTYQGVTLDKTSFSGTALLATTSQSNKDLLALVQALGKTPDDLSFAVASDSTNKLGIIFGAYRIKGADATAWSAGLYQIAEKGTPGSTATDANLGGRAVKRVTDPTSPQVTYAWPKGDILYIVVTTTDALAGPAIAAFQ